MQKFWTHLKLKNGDQVKFVPPAPDGQRLGGITKDERELISDLEQEIHDPDAGLSKLKDDMSALMGTSGTPLTDEQKAAVQSAIGILSVEGVTY